MPTGISGLSASMLTGQKVQAADLDGSFALPSTAIVQAALRPDQIGLAVWNASGSPITAGSLVYVSGWNAANNQPQVSLATAVTLATPAQWIALGAIANGASGLVGKHLLLTGQNTNAGTVGDMVYLSATPGAYVLTNVPVAGVQQTVGQITVKSATVGVINLQILDTFPIVNQRLNLYVPPIATAAGAYVANSRVATSGMLIGAAFVPNSALAASDTNYLSLAMTDGVTALLAANTNGVNTTKQTGGAALVQSAPFGLTIVGGLTLTAGDVITATFTVTGTLAGAINGGVVSLIIFPV